MKRILLPLLAALALPTAVNAEKKVTMTETLYNDQLSYASFVGSLLSICHAEKEGYINTIEKLYLINHAVSLHKSVHKKESTLKESQQDAVKNTSEVYPDCLPK